MNIIKNKLTTAIVTITTMTLASIITLPLQAQANDGAYYMSGNQLVPMHTTQIDVKKELLDIRREGDDIVVDVHYELYNKGKPISLLVGFEAMPPSGDANGLPKNGEHPFMKNFTAKVNGKSTKYQVALVPTGEHWKHIDGDTTLGLDQAKPPFYFKNGRINQEKESTLLARSDGYETNELYVYHFSANFKSGNNVIDHHYRFEASGSVGEMFNFEYVLKAINRWGDSTIDDFQLNLDMGEMIEFNILNTFFDSADEWKVDGVGKIYPTQSCDINHSTTFAMRSGKVTFNKKNFTPKGDIYVSSPYFALYDGNFNASNNDLLFNYTWIGSVDTLDDFSRKVLRNFPFARRGYVFKNAKLQAYYKRQPWYIADPRYKAEVSKLDESEQAYIKQFK